MKAKRIVLVTLLLLAFLTLGIVSASDENTTSDNLAVDEDLCIESSVGNGEILSDTVGNLSELSTLIENTPEGGTLELDKDYQGDIDMGIPISKSITLDGKGHKLNINAGTEIFSVENSIVNLKNIVFTCKGTIVGGSSENGGGGISNCSFVNCSSDYFGGILSITGLPNFNISNCNFLNCTSNEEDGVDGIIVIARSAGKIADCNFKDIKGAAIFSGYDNTRGSVVNCSFVNCYSTRNGGAISILGREFNVLDCDFVKCGCEDYGGAIFLQVEEEGNIIGCSFTDCSVGMSGGAISGYGNVFNCEFLGCSAEENGGAINFDAYSFGNVVNCSFVKCSSANGGAVYAEEESDVRISASYFENNKATETGGAVYGGIVFDSVLTKNSKPEIDSDNNYAEVIPEKIVSNDDGVIALEFPLDAKGTLTVFIDQTHKKVYDIVGGIMEIDLSEFKGEYSITFEYSGDDNYPGFSKTALAVIKVIPAKIKAKNANVLYSAGQKYTLTVYEMEGKKANKAKVVVKVNGKKFKTIKTNKKGVASFEVTQAPGKYKLTLISLERTVSKTLTVKHLLTLKTANVKKSAKELVLTATLGKVNKKILKGKKISFKFNGKTYSAKTDKKGVAKVTIKSSELKKLKVGKKVAYQATYLKDTVKKSSKIKK